MKKPKNISLIQHLSPRNINLATFITP